MYLSWTMDERPRWRVEFVFDILSGELHRPGRPEAVRLERDLAASGRVRGAEVRFMAGQVAVRLWLKAVDDMEATASALTMLDHAVARVPGVALAELRWRQARPSPRR